MLPFSYLDYTPNLKNNKVILTDKKTGEIYKDFITIIDRKDNGDSYNFGAVKGDKPKKAILKSYKLKENNHQNTEIFTIYKKIWERLA